MAVYVNKISDKLVSAINGINSLAVSSLNSISLVLFQTTALLGNYIKISAGGNHNLTIKDNNITNNISVWGKGNFGALGIRNILTQVYLTELSGFTKTYCEINSGYYVNTAINNTGKIWCWGYNIYGQVGDNTVVCRSTPVAIGGVNKTFCKINLTLYHNIALDFRGKAWVWGYNNLGQLGINSIINRSTPIGLVMATNRTFCEISAGNAQTLVLDFRGKAWAWGSNQYGQLGNNSVTCVSTPVAVGGVSKTFCHIRTYQLTTLALDFRGKAWAWGYNIFGYMGTNSTTSRRTPFAVTGVHTFCKITQGESTSHAIDKDGKIWAWGYNMWGKLGIGSTISRSTPFAIGGVNKTFCQISGGQYHTIALDKYNYVWGWGRKDSLNDSTIKPQKSSGININILSSGTNQVLVISGNTTAWGWGYNNQGSLGINLGTGSRRSPLSVMGVKKTFCQISAGNNYTMSGINQNGKIWSWGNNQYGQVGDNTITSRSTPVAIGGVNKTFCEISRGNSFAASIDFRGKVWTWGYNNLGQLGDNTVVSKRTPVAIGGVNKTFCHISIGFHCVGITYTGKLWAWGRNNNGEIGDATKTCRSTPVAVGGVNKTFCSIASSSYYHNLAIDFRGQIWTWGSNAYGGLGNNQVTDRCTPVAISGVNKTFCKISAGYYCSFGIDFRGTVWAWGYNDGTLGTNDNVSRRTPVVLYNMTDKTFCQVSAGNNYTIIVDNNNNAYAWGNTTYGQLGYDYVSLTPIKLFV